MYKVAMIVSILFLATGCTSINIKIDSHSDPLKPTFMLHKGAFFKGSAPVHGIEVSTDSHVVWLIDTTNGRTENLYEVKYGVVPVGFLEHKKAKDLQIGLLYKFFWRHGDAGKKIYFRIVDKNGKLEVHTVE